MGRLKREKNDVSPMVHSGPAWSIRGGPRKSLLIMTLTHWSTWSTLLLKLVEFKIRGI